MNKSVFIKSLIVGFALLLTPSIAVMQWYTHNHPVYPMSLQWLQQSPEAANYIGKAIRSGWWVSLRSSRHTLTANMEYDVSGSRGHGELLVSAKKSGENWELHTVWYRPEGGRIIPLLDSRKPD